MTKEKILEILNKKMEAARKDFEYWSSKYEVSFAKLDLLKELLDELSASESEEGDQE